MDGWERPWLGGMLYLSGGFITGEFSALQASLTPSLGAGYDTAPAGFMYGGGGGIFLGPVWLGGKGYGMHVSTTPHSLADTSLTASGGGGELGFALATRRFLLVPFVGLGGFSYKLHVTDKSGALQVFQGETLSPGNSADFTASLLVGEVGLRANRLILFGEGTFLGGVGVGAELGYMAALSRDAWAGNNAAASESASVRGAYFRIVVGGVGALFKKEGE
jgi:hypothetical protein